MPGGRDEIRKRVTVEDEASQTLRNVAGEQEQLAEGTREAGQASEQQSQAAEQQRGTLRGLTRGVGQMVASWVSFTAIVGAIVNGLRRIRDEAREAADAVVELADAARDVHVNMGQQAGDQVISAAEQIAQDRQLGEAGEQQLLQMAGRMTDRAEFARDPQRVERRLERAAPLTAFTDAGGAQIQELIFAAEQAGFEDAEAAVASILTGPLGEREALDLLRQGGREGLELTLAALETGDIDDRRFRRQSDQFFRSVMETDAAGRVGRDLRRFGIEEGMGLEDRVRMLSDALEGDDPRRAAMAREIVGDQMLQFMPAIGTALEGEALGQVRRDLVETDPDAELARLRESRIQEQAARRRTAEHRETIIDRDPDRAERQISLEEHRQLVRQELRRMQDEGEIGVIDRAFRRGVFEAGTFLGADPEATQERLTRFPTLPDASPPDRAPTEGQTIIQQQNNVHEQYNFNGDNPLTDPAPEVID